MAQIGEEEKVITIESQPLPEPIEAPEPMTVPEPATVPEPVPA